MLDLGHEIAALEEDMQEFNLEKTVKQGLKTPEELDKLTVDESLNDIDRAAYLLSTGQEVQLVSVIKNIPHLLRHHQAECLRRVLPKVKELLLTAGSEVQMAATESYLTIAKNDLVNSSLYTQHFLRTIISNIEGRDPVIAQAWLETLLSVILCLPRETIKREILGLAIAKGQLSQPTSSRITCCSILGAIATKFDSYIVKKDIIHSVKQLCQDVDYEVRASMCKHLCRIAQGLGREETKKCILDEVIELARDEETSVREAAFESVLDMTQYIDDESLADNVVPLMCKYCEQAVENEDSTLLSVSKHFGRLCHKISHAFNQEQRTWMLSCYRYLCKLGYTSDNANENNFSGIDSNEDNEIVPDTSAPIIPVQKARFETFHGFLKTSSSALTISPTKQAMYVECRRGCAFNLPAMVQFAGPDDFKKELLDSTTIMCTDPDNSVRKSLASGIHEIARILDEHAFLLHGHLVSLLRERHSSAVMDSVISNLSRTMFCVMSRGSYGLSDIKPTATSELIAALLSAISRLEQQWVSSWRTLENLVVHLQHLPDIISSDHIYYKFVPVVFKLINSNRYLPVKEASVKTICVFIRHNRKQEQKKELCARLIQDLCYGRNYKSRILFFSACRHMMALFSKSYFKENLFEHVLNLFHDPVANVRLSLCSILPSLKSLLKLPRDRALHQQLESSVRHLLSSEKDRDVSSSVRFAILELDRTEVAMESLTQGTFMADDLHDQKKEEEERLLIEREERSKDDDRSLKNMDSSFNSSVGKEGSTNSWPDKSNRHRKQRRASKNSLAAGSSSANTPTSNHKVNGTRHKSTHHLVGTQQTPVFLHQKDGLPSSTAVQYSGLPSGTSHSPIPAKRPSKFPPPSSTLTSVSNSTSSPYAAFVNSSQSLSDSKLNAVSGGSSNHSRSDTTFSHKPDRIRSPHSSVLLSHRTSSTHANETKTRKGTNNVVTSGSSLSKSNSRSSRQTTGTGKSDTKKKTQNSTTRKKSDRSDLAR
uniref:serine/threonine-protein phosphatase 4 regulatory subunit 4-like n=1 Tax=Styela clava TaxID=7725 RepID=UPI00193ADE18|nr:serine/threonine-protein phosphatase 4 regulatory subunit 4-like [Styela clava]